MACVVSVESLSRSDLVGVYPPLTHYALLMPQVFYFKFIAEMELGVMRALRCDCDCELIFVPEEDQL